NRIELKGSQPDQVLFARDGNLLIGLRDGTVMKLEPSGANVWIAPRTHPAYRIALSPDGKTVAVGSDNAIVLLDAATGKEQRQIPSGSTQWVTFAPDGKRVAAAVNGEVHLVDLDTGRHHDFEMIRNVVRHPWLALAYSPDGKYLACTNSDNWAVQQHQVTMINLATNAVGATLSGHAD